MPIITRLPDSVANKISAGEVVQRPASVVKELLENAIDAGATKISIAIKDAGKELIRISDNGVGMNRDDALLCVERFATSKIKSADDLDALHTLGFRGEALASICSVSHFELKTRQADATLGLLFRYDGGTLVEEFEVQAEQGTSFSVRNLFYNVPARRKFLKSNATEYHHLFEIVKSFTLAYPEIEWRMVNDDDELFNFKNNDVLERLNFYYGDDFASSLIEVAEQNDYLPIHGYLGKPALQKKRKLEQYFFINRRLVQNRMLLQAVQQAYGDLLVERQTPFVLLFLTIDPSRIDVNVHPAKLEIRFDDERQVRSMFYPVIKRAVQLHDFSPNISAVEPFASVSEPFSGSSFQPTFSSTSSPSPRMGGGSRRFDLSDAPERAITKNELYRNYQEGAFSSPSVASYAPTATPSPVQQGGLFATVLAEESLFGAQAVQEASENIEAFQLSPLDSIVEHKEVEPKIWQLHNKYLICQIKTGLMIIDQHVAHERVLYERALEVMQQNVPNAQQLLFPQKVEFRAWEYEVFEEIREDLYRLGFNVRLFGNRTVMIEGVPQDVKSGSEVTILQDMITQYQENATKLKLERRDNLAKSYSCRNAIMTGQKLSMEEMRSLIDNLFATREPYTCPHGRPIIIKLSLDQLDKMFGRK